VKTKIFYVAMALVMVLSLVGVAAGVAAPGQPVKAATTTWYVDDNCVYDPGNGTEVDPFCLIQAAINAANPGDTVVVNPGKYVENLTIEHSLTLRSSTGDWRDVDLDEPPGDGITISGPGHVTVQGLEIHGFEDGIHIDDIQHGGSVSIVDCFIHSNFLSGIWGDTLDGLLHIDGCIISQNGGGPTGVHLEDVGSETTGGTVVVTDSVIGAWYDLGEATMWSGNGGDGIKVENIWPMSTVTIGDGGHSGWMFSEENIGPDNVIAWNEGDGIDIGYLNGTLNIAGNAIGGWDFGMEVSGRVGGNEWDGIEITSTSPGSSAVIRDNAISENGFDSDGIEIEYVDGSLDILDNIIGAWVCYEYDGGEPVADETFAGNHHNGIKLSDVDGTVLIDGNKIAGNGGGGSDGIYIGAIETEDEYNPSTGEWVLLRGSVTISNNDVGEWTDAEEETLWGNADDGIDISDVGGGCTLAIGPNNDIVDNGDCGIELFAAEAAADVTIFDNTLMRNGTGHVGIMLFECYDVTVDGNTISQHETGIALWGESAGNAIINNTITNNMGDSEEYGRGIEVGNNAHHNGIVGNLIADNGDGIYVHGDRNDILCNVITGNDVADTGVHFCWDADDNVLNHNNIVDNGDIATGSYGVFNNNPDETLDARWNWWGHSSGPYNGGTNPDGEGDPVGSYIDYSGWATSAFGYGPTPGDYDTASPDILTAVAMPDMISLYTAIEEWTEEWWLSPFFEFEEEFGFTPGPGESNYLVETTDIDEDGAQPRGIRYVTLDLEGAVAQLLGVQSLWQVEPPEWIVHPVDRAQWLEQWHMYAGIVEDWGRMQFEEGCPRPVWFKEAAFRFTLAYVYWMYFDWGAGYSKLFEMMEPGEVQIGVTVEDWTGNIRTGQIDLAIVDVALPM